MKLSIQKILFLFVIISCSPINRDTPVDKSSLKGRDYRLFQNTAAWDLAKAVQDGKEKKIKMILDKDSTLINFQEPVFGNTLLKITIKNQQFKQFKILLENNADVNIPDTYDGTSPIIEACSYNFRDKKFVSLLLQYGANVNDVEVGERRQGNNIRFTPLMAASRTGSLDMVKLLVENGANINFYNEYNQSALLHSILQNNYGIVLYLLENGADYNRSILYRQEKDKDMYLVDFLREDFFRLSSKKYKEKMKVVAFLQTKGIDYYSTPIPDYIIKKAQEKYPRTWQDYLEKY